MQPGVKTEFWYGANRKNR